MNSFLAPVLLARAPDRHRQAVTITGYLKIQIIGRYGRIYTIGQHTLHDFLPNLGRYMLMSSYPNGIKIRSAISACLKGFGNFSLSYSHAYERYAEWIFEHLAFAEANDGTATRLFDKLQADMRHQRGRHGALTAFTALGYLLRHDVFGCNKSLYDILSAAVIGWAHLARSGTSYGVELLRGLGGKGTPNSAAVNAVVRYAKDPKQLERKYLESNRAGARASVDTHVAAILHRLIKPIRKPRFTNVVPDGATFKEVTRHSPWSGQTPISCSCTRRLL